MDWQEGESTSMPGLDTLPWINQLHWEDMEERADREGKRPLIFSRFGGYGAGRYNIGFSGDTYSTWESLAYQPYFTSTASNVLFGYWSHDIGGHMPGAIEPELYTRWVQYGIYSPILRTHTTQNPDAERRVWEYPAPYSDIMINSIRQRYEMVPYIYCENRKAFDSAISLCRPMYYNYPGHEEAYSFKDQYMFGDEILVAPVVAPVEKSSEMAEVEVWLPEGQWFDTARNCSEEGNQVIKRKYLLNEIPVFVRPGTVIPQQKWTKRLNDKCYKNLVMSIYTGETGSYTLYEDDGISTEYLIGKSVMIEMSHHTKGNSKVIKLHKKQGDYKGYEKNRKLEIRLEASVPPVKVTVGDQVVDWVYRLDDVDEGWSYKGRTGTAVIKLNSVNLDDGVEVKVEYPSDIDYKLPDGLKGLFNRLERVNYFNTMLTGCFILHPEERLGQELSHAAYRISRKPETLAYEVEKVYEKLPALVDMLDSLGRVFDPGNFGEMDRAQIAGTAVDLIKESGYLDC